MIILNVHRRFSFGLLFCQIGFNSHVFFSEMESVVSPAEVFSLCDTYNNSNHTSIVIYFEA